MQLKTLAAASLAAVALNGCSAEDLFMSVDRHILLQTPEFDIVRIDELRGGSAGSVWHKIIFEDKSTGDEIVVGEFDNISDISIVLNGSSFEVCREGVAYLEVRSGVWKGREFSIDWSEC